VTLDRLDAVVNSLALADVSTAAAGRFTPYVTWGTKRGIIARTPR